MGEYENRVKEVQAENRALMIERANMQYRPEILAVGETTWANNAVECETYEEAAASARQTFMNWFAADTWRVVTTDTPKRQPYVPGSEDPDAPPR